MAPPRVKQSCIPCRQRKSRCNAEIPCSSCLLRGTESDCQLPSASTPTPRRKPPGGSTSRRSSVNPQPYPARPPQLPPTYSTPAAASEPEYPAPSLEDRELWSKLLDTLPQRASCEILLEYLLVECDWLCHFGDVVSIWERVIARGAVDRSTAGFLYMTLALPSLLLGDHGSPLYRPLNPQEEHPRLYALAESCMPPKPVTMMDYELYLAMLHYEIFSGATPAPGRIFHQAMASALDAGFYDESLPQWSALSNEERSHRRRIGWGLHTIYRWTLLYPGPDAFQGVRLNLCRPDMIPTTLNHPVTLLLPPRSHVAGDTAEQGFRILRIRSQEEMHHVARYRHMLSDLTDLLPRVAVFVKRIDKVDTEVSLAECELLLREINEWWDVTLPAAGFAEVAPENIDATNIVSCRYAAQALILRLALGHISANLLRYWLEVGDINASSPSPHKRLYQACLDNAKRALDAVPTVRKLVKSRHGPFIVPFIALNLFNAATSFAIPVLRSVRYWSSRDTSVDIASLPAWPDSSDPRNRPPVPSHSALGRLPPGIYNDSMVKECATNILVILEALSTLNANPLGQTAERRLNELITQYGLRDVTTVQSQVPYHPGLIVPPAPPCAAPAGVGPLGPPLDSDGRIGTNHHGHGHNQHRLQQPPIMGPSGRHVGEVHPPVAPTPEMSGLSGFEHTDDMAFISSLLQMDASVWEGLLEAGALTGRDGQPVV